MQNSIWLLLLYGLPAKGNTVRVTLCRKLKNYGAVQLKTSAYVLPDWPEHYERFQWLATEINESGGEATLIRGPVLTRRGRPGLCGSLLMLRRSLCLGRSLRSTQRRCRSTWRKWSSRIMETIARWMECFEGLYQQLQK